MLIKDKEINLHIGGMAVEQYFTELAEDVSDFGPFSYLPFTFGMVISACANNWTRLNGGRKQIDRKEIIEWFESDDPTEDQVKEANELVMEFFDSMHMKKKVAFIEEVKEDIKKKTKSSTGKITGKRRIKQELSQTNTTGGDSAIQS